MVTGGLEERVQLVVELAALERDFGHGRGAGVARVGEPDEGEERQRERGERAVRDGMRGRGTGRRRWEADVRHRSPVGPWHRVSLQCERWSEIGLPMGWSGGGGYQTASISSTILRLRRWWVR